MNRGIVKERPQRMRNGTQVRVSEKSKHHAGIVAFINSYANGDSEGYVILETVGGLFAVLEEHLVKLREDATHN